MDQTTTEQLISECYYFARLVHNTYSLEIDLLDNHEYRAYMYPHSFNALILNDAILSLRNALKSQVKDVVEKDIKRACENVKYFQKELELANAKAEELELALNKL